MTLNLGKRPPRRRRRGGSRAGSLNPDNRRLYLDAMGGRAVGLLPAARFVSTRVHLSPGDTLVLYTDGLTEAKTGTGAERYDDDNALIEFAAAHP